MNRRDLCVARIEQVRILANDPELAYAARSRLHRAILACTDFVAHEMGLSAPHFPNTYEVPANAPYELRRICEVTNYILSRSRSICQPSEPLDDRWSEGWSTILAQLDELERILLVA